MPMWSIIHKMVTSFVAAAVPSRGLLSSYDFSKEDKFGTKLHVATLHVGLT